MSKMFGVEWDQLTPIPMGQDKVLDYQVPIPGAQLQVEAKGTTSAKGRENLARAAWRKKLSDPKDLNSPVKTFTPPLAMLAVIVEAALAGTVIQIIDPKPRPSDLNIDDSAAAGRYHHYAGFARFAGLNLAAEELDRRARQRAGGNGLPRGSEPSPSRPKLPISEASRPSAAYSGVWARPVLPRRGSTRPLT